MCGDHTGDDSNLNEGCIVGRLFIFLYPPIQRTFLIVSALTSWISTAQIESPKALHCARVGVFRYSLHNSITPRSAQKKTLIQSPLPTASNPGPLISHKTAAELVYQNEHLPVARISSTPQHQFLSTAARSTTDQNYWPAEYQISRQNQAGKEVRVVNEYLNLQNDLWTG